jgi:hypothetical protein
MFLLKAIGPPHIVGAISLVAGVHTVCAVLMLPWPLAGIYVTGGAGALSERVVGVTQAFQKLPFLHASRHGTEPPFGPPRASLFAFIALGVAAVRLCPAGAPP